MLLLTWPPSRVLKLVIAVNTGWCSVKNFPLLKRLGRSHNERIDGGKVRLRTERGLPCEWRDYKAVRLQDLYYGAFFQDNLSLTDWVNSQPLTNPVICLGDGHDGVWNLFKEIATTEQRQEILDWYHLKENLYKVGGSRKRIRQAEALLWRGRVEDAIAIFDNCHRRQVVNFLAYLKKHRLRLVDYETCQQLQPGSIGSGAVESALRADW